MKLKSAETETCLWCPEHDSHTALDKDQELWWCSTVVAGAAVAVYNQYSHYFYIHNTETVYITSASAIAGISTVSVITTNDSCTRRLVAAAATCSI